MIIFLGTSISFTETESAFIGIFISFKLKGWSKGSNPVKVPRPTLYSSVFTLCEKAEVEKIIHVIISSLDFINNFFCLLFNPVFGFPGL